LCMSWWNDIFLVYHGSILIFISKCLQSS
jgi:hypothetical protein